jgi:hypothetical protein
LRARSPRLTLTIIDAELSTMSLILLKLSLAAAVGFFILALL